MIKLLSALLLVISLSSPARATVVNPSPTGGDDTHNIQTVCNAGGIVQLVKGTYHVSSVSCKYIVGLVPANECYFWNEGVTCPTTIVGTSTNGAPTIVCPSSGCAYSNFALNPAQGGAPGIGTSATIHGISIDGMLIADIGGGSGSCIDLSGSQNNQELLISNTTLIHCGAGGTSAWCVNAGVTSDSFIRGNVIFANCGAGGLLISYGFGWDIRPSRVEGMFTGTGIAWVNGGQGTIDVGGAFDENLWDVSLGGYEAYSGSGSVSGGSVYLSIAQAMNTRTSGGSSFTIEGQVAIVGGNFFIGSTTFHVNPSLPTNTFYACGNNVLSPTYTDTYSQQVVSPFLNTACQ